MRMWIKILLVLLFCGQVFGSNDFNDANCVSLYRFEDGALTTDTIGTNTLTTNNSPVSDTGDYQEGAACVDLEAGDLDSYDIQDTSLSSDFPGKAVAGNAGTDLGLCAWIKLESLPTSSAPYYSSSVIAAKVYPGGTARSWNCRVALNGSDTQQAMWISYDGTNVDSANNTSFNLSTGTWYHVGYSWDDSEKAYIMRLTEPNDTTHDASGTFDHDMYSTNGNFWVGTFYANAGQLDGLIDELVIFNRPISLAEITAIYEGNFPLSGSSGQVLPVIMVNSAWEKNRWRGLWQ